MSPRRLPPAVLAALASAALVQGACGGGDEEPAPGRPDAEAPATSAPEPPGGEGLGDPAPADEPEPGGKPPRGESGPAEGPAADPRVTELEREAAATVRAYIAALDARDGERVCSLLAPGAIESVELPVRRGGCATSLTASIGFRDPRGLPVWKGADVLEPPSVKTAGAEATVVATVLTRFADRLEPSIEDDVVYLERSGGRWLVAKPTTTLYRAVGVADIPPVVLAPPSERT